jgi:hypothetical protein
MCAIVVYVAWWSGTGLEEKVWRRRGEEKDCLPIIRFFFIEK